jgi:hypothetical protein
MKLSVTALLIVCLFTLTYAQTTANKPVINKPTTTNKTPQEKEFIKEYYYRVGDDDSRNSARAKALEQAKLLILEEIGVYIESHLEVSNTYSKQQMREEIKTVTAGILKTKILEEKFNGKTFYVKVNTLVNTKEVADSFTKLSQIGAYQKEIQELKAEIQNLQKSLYTQKTQYEEMRHKLFKEMTINTDLETQLAICSQQQKYYVSPTVICKTKKGTAMSKVTDQFGSPDSAYSDMYTYGEVRVYFKDGKVTDIYKGYFNNKCN